MNPPRNRKGETGNPPPKGGAPVPYPTKASHHFHPESWAAIREADG